MSRRAATLLLGAALLAGCAPAPAPPAPAASASAAPAAAPPASATPAPVLRAQPPVQSYTATGQAPAWRAAVAQGALTVERPGQPSLTTAVVARTYARGVEFEGRAQGSRLLLAITSEAPCLDPAGQPQAYAAMLIVEGASHPGCALPEP